MLTAAELDRYARQLTLAEVGVSGQERLRSARVLVVGAGGLGSPAALYLAAAGVGTIGIVDDDRVELHNLHRQIIHGTGDVGRDKAHSAAAAIGRLNPDVAVEPHALRLTPRTAPDLLARYHLVIDGSDNFATRYVVNDTCVERALPWVYGSVERFSGQVAVFAGDEGPCYRCLYPEAPAPGSAPSCEDIGVLGAVPGVVGSLQAAEALKWVLGVGEPLTGKLLQLDLARARFHSIVVEKRADCPACARRGAGNHRGPADSRDAGPEPPDATIEPAELAQRLRGGESPALLDILEPWETAINRIGNARVIPMNHLPAALDEIEPTSELVVYCHHGARSQMVVDWLREQGIPARNLAGGIDRWSREVDPGVPRY